MIMTVGSLFSGIGGLDLGLERAGMQIQFQVELDPFCQQVLAKHWPEVKRYGDIRTVGDGLDSVDLICGGFPCQPVSIAGRKRGKADDRYLWPEMLRVVRCIRPRFVLAENVYGLVTHNGGVLLAGIYADLEAAGYEVCPPIVFPAAAVGAPHGRDRVWILAHTNSGRLPHLARDRDYLCDKERTHQAESQRWQGQSQSRSGADGQTAAHTHSQRRQELEGGTADGILDRRPGLSADRQSTGTRDWWSIEPNVGRVADGISRRVDRLRGLGNAVVPQVAELLGRLIIRSAEAAEIGVVNK